MKVCLSDRTVARALTATAAAGVMLAVSAVAASPSMAQSTVEAGASQNVARVSTESYERLFCTTAQGRRLSAHQVVAHKATPRKGVKNVFASIAGSSSAVTVAGGHISPDGVLAQSLPRRKAVTLWAVPRQKLQKVTVVVFDPDRAFEWCHVHAYVRPRPASWPE